MTLSIESFEYTMIITLTCATDMVLQTVQPAGVLNVTYCYKKIDATFSKPEYVSRAETCSPSCQNLTCSRSKKL